MPVINACPPRSCAERSGARSAARVAVALVALAASSLAASIASAGDICASADHDCFTQGGPGCTDLECCATVCAQDPFCCNESWDGICVEEAQTFCIGVSCPTSDHDCLTTGAPGCTDTVCCEAICLVDPFCCESAWDSVCVLEAAQTCGGTIACPESNHDCLTTGAPGCTDLACCDLVCALDPACCALEWDALCVTMAVQLCNTSGCNQTCPADLNEDGMVDGGDLGLLLSAWGQAGCADLSGNGTVDGGDLGLLLAEWGACPSTCPPSDHDCFTAGFPGCTDLLCCTIVCETSPFCCENFWDNACVEEAFQSCGGCGSAVHDCFSVGSPGCSDAACCASVCLVDTSCCAQSWDTGCVNVAIELCGYSGSTCCIPNGGLGCDDDACEGSVCTADAFCCEVAWDQQCASQAAVLCPLVCQGGGSVCLESDHDCFTTGGPGCSDLQCCEVVCAIDPACCSLAWDNLCVATAVPVCGYDGSDCCIATDALGCDDAACAAAVCELDPTCCSESWDSTCATLASVVCPGLCGSPIDSSCCEAGSTPGCNTPSCQNLVCSEDIFCCTVAWDEFCVIQAFKLCGGLCE
ncbi:MAG: hypothetical protein KDA22_01415 [Phycisphaerales bacterium]|nr:hypothetical protein [Phycisphaerales bacterium]